MTTTQWQYLEKRPNSRKQQLYIKERRLKAFSVWCDMIVEQMTPEEVAESKDIPLGAVKEAIKYCKSNQDLLQREAKTERRHLEERGYSLESKNPH